MLWPGSDCWQYRWPVSLPFSQHGFQAVIDKLCLPIITPWVCLTEEAHFQRYQFGCAGCGSSHIGITLRQPNGGAFALDISFSASYNPITGCTNALVLSDSAEHLEYILQQTVELDTLVSNPLLLPTLISSHTVVVLESFLSERWSEFLRAEIASGQSGSEPFGPNDHYGLSRPMEFQDFKDLTKAILRIVQLVTSYERYLQEIFLCIESMQETIKNILLKALADH
ncbi:hypothetical protein BGZ57DRAFT_918915 [Hyaloscypha finlandica]|nr:hypothetical protein BGZ57DRAFT_918915 [Hyaloscypha finlandica]